MSTHLTHAFFLHLPDSRLVTVQAWAAPLRQRLLALGQEIRCQWLVEEAIRRHDLAHLGLGDWPAAGQSWMQLAHQDGQEKLRALRRQERCPELDIEVTVALFEDSLNPGHLHGLHFVELPALRRLLLDQPEVEPRPYQDQTDERPEGMSESEWQARRHLWERLIPQGIPSQAGVTVTLVDDRVPLLFPDEAQTQAAWPTLESRCKKVRVDAFFDEFYALLRASGEAPTERRWRDGLRWITPDSPWMSWITERVGEQLDAHLTPGELFRPF